MRSATPSSSSDESYDAESVNNRHQCEYQSLCPFANVPHGIMSAWERLIFLLNIIAARRLVLEQKYLKIAQTIKQIADILKEYEEMDAELANIEQEILQKMNADPPHGTRE